MTLGQETRWAYSTQCSRANTGHLVESISHTVTPWAVSIGLSLCWTFSHNFMTIHECKINTTDRQIGETAWYAVGRENVNFAGIQCGVWLPLQTATPFSGKLREYRRGRLSSLKFSKTWPLPIAKTGDSNRCSHYWTWYILLVNWYMLYASLILGSVSTLMVDKISPNKLALDWCM